MINPVTETQEVFLDDESEESIAFEPGKISNASDYMLLYKLLYKNSDNYAPQVQALDSLPLLDAAALNSVWPMSNFWAKPADEAHSPVDMETLSLGSMRSLRDASMRTVMEKGIESDPSDDSGSQKRSSFKASLSHIVHLFTNIQAQYKISVPNCSWAAR